MIAIVTDSTCDLSTGILKQYDIKVIPLHIHFGESDFMDNVTIHHQTFYDKLDSPYLDHPTTSPPSIEEFHNFYNDLVADYDDIISIHIGSFLSDTYKHALRTVSLGRMRFMTKRLRSKRFKRLNIRVIDSHNVSLGTGLLVILAAQWMAEGLTGEQIENRVLAMRDRIQILFTVKDLIYMRRSEKVSALKHFLGNLLGINPIIQGTKSALIPFKSARGMNEAINEMIIHVINSMDMNQIKMILISEIGGNHQENFQKLRQKLLSLEQNIDIIPCSIGPTIGTHAGPGGIELAFVAKE